MNRRLRGTLGAALIWGIGWTGLGLAVSAVKLAALAALDAPVAELAPVVLGSALRWGLFGVVAGVLFALPLRRLGRRAGSLQALSARRASLWGGIAGAVLPLGVMASLTGGAGVPGAAALLYVGVGVAFGSATGAGTVALARRAPGSTRSLDAGQRLADLAPPVA
jgi:hypothetical protein